MQDTKMNHRSIKHFFSKELYNNMDCYHTQHISQNCYIWVGSQTSWSCAIQYHDYVTHHVY